MVIGAIIQARTTSTRLPKKIIQNLPYNSTNTVLEQVIRRTMKSDRLNEIIIATTKNSIDDELVKISEKLNCAVFRGSEHDVLERYYKAADLANLDVIVRITSDCPCIDWNIIDELLSEFQKNKYDYLANSLKPTFPHGLDVEVFTFEALAIAYEEANNPAFREHVTPYLYSNKKFKINNYEASIDCFGPDIRITLDTSEDYALLCYIFEYFELEKKNFVCQDIIKLFKEKPWLKMINKNITQKKVIKNFKDEIDESLQILGFQGLNNARDFLKKRFEESENMSID